MHGAHMTEQFNESLEIYNCTVAIIDIDLNYSILESMEPYKYMTSVK